VAGWSRDSIDQGSAASWQPYRRAPRARPSMVELGGARTLEDVDGFIEHHRPLGPAA
jgi:hypothetical protein